MANAPRFLPTKEAAAFLGIEYNTLHSEITRKRQAGLGHLFQKEGRSVYVDVANYRTKPNAADEDDIMEVERLYYDALEICGNDHTIAERIAPMIGVKKSAVYMRLRDFRFKTNRVADQMKKGLKAIVEGEAAPVELTLKEL